MTEPHRVQVLFVGQSVSRIAWYRIVLPAMYLGCDWIGVSGEPPRLQFATGYVKGDTRMARFEDYDVVVIQQPRGRGWFRLIGKLQARGIVVLYEIDDYAHGIRKAKDHDFREMFAPEDLRDMELCMRTADGLVCSTDYIARRYRQFNRRVFVCGNGLDMARYRLGRPQRPQLAGKQSVTIMWSGATGHAISLAPWLEVVDDLMGTYPHVRFCSIGYDFDRGRHPDRTLTIPFSALETYPGAMTIGDVALAPAGHGSFTRGKSALRAIEAGALGIPVVADPVLYEDAVIDGVTGMLADTPSLAHECLESLIRDERLRLQLGNAARSHIATHFDMRVRIENWKRAIIETLNGRSANGRVANPSD